MLYPGKLPPSLSCRTHMCCLPFVSAWWEHWQHPGAQGSFWSTPGMDAEVPSSFSNRWWCLLGGLRDSSWSLDLLEICACAGVREGRDVKAPSPFGFCSGDSLEGALDTQVWWEASPPLAGRWNKLLLQIPSNSNFSGIVWQVHCARGLRKKNRGNGSALLRKF